VLELIYSNQRSTHAVFTNEEIFDRVRRGCVQRRFIVASALCASGRRAMAKPIFICAWTAWF
jgi:hypothetical protein